MNTYRVAVKCLALAAFFKITHVNATAIEYHVVLDAGSSGTRAVVYEKALGAPAKVSVLFEKSTNWPLASFAEQPEQAWPQVIGPLLGEAAVYLQENGYRAQQPRVSVLGTAGMRLISAQHQSAIYRSLQAKVTESSFFTPGAFHTISGRQEGLFAWVDVNYHAGNFDQGRTQGIIEVGGASAQVAFDSTGAGYADAMAVRINGRDYEIYSHSFLGLGANEARQSAGKHSGPGACHAPGYNTQAITGSFSWVACREAYSTVLGKPSFNELQRLAQWQTFQAQDFIGVGVVYYALDFFDALVPDTARLLERIERTCSARYASLEDESRQAGRNTTQVHNQCGNGVFVHALLFDALKLTDGRITALDRIGPAKLRWTTGYVLLEDASAAKVAER